MKALAFFGSLFLGIYILMTLAFTIVNISKVLFELNREEQGYRFWARQGLILMWPLVAITKEGRETLAVIWEGNPL
jgi:hypothetical protein